MKEAPAEAEVVRGTIDRVTFRNASNGYSVLQVLVEGSRDRITVVGMAPSAAVGSYVTMTGAFITHPKFGKQFTLHSLTETPPSTSDGIERYLSSGLIAGVGKKTAERIVKEFGEQSLEIIRSDPDKIAQIDGVERARPRIHPNRIGQVMVVLNKVDGQCLLLTAPGHRPAQPVKMHGKPERMAKRRRARPCPSTSRCRRN